jgi:hypothetical protein
MILSDLIFKNFWLKFFSVALATVIWFGIHFGIHNEISVSELDLSSRQAEELIRVPVTILSVPGDTRSFRITPAAVLVVATGEKNALRQAADKDIRAYVNLGNFRVAYSPNEEIHVDHPPEITVREVSPQTVAVEQLQPGH